jgi:hypothetical protein
MSTLATALWAASALLSASTGATATTDPAAQPRGSSSAPYDATWASLNTRAFPAWYNQAKFGFKIHWGPYAVPGWGQKYDAEGRQEPVFAQSCLYEYVTLVSSLPFQCIDEDCKHSLFLAADTCFSCASAIHVDHLLLLCEFNPRHLLLLCEFNPRHLLLLCECNLYCWQGQRVWLVSRALLPSHPS